MRRISYSKQLQSFTDQIDLLKQRGLKFSDESKALHLLQNISYYRLSGYWYPMLANKTLHTFKPGSTFEQAYEIYKFDSKLRKLVTAELEKIEVAIRTQVAYTFSAQYGGRWLTQFGLFSDPARHIQTLAKIGREYGRSDEQFVKAFKAKYQEPFPPSWITMEITSFGTLSMLYASFIPCTAKREIAAYFGLSDSVFTSWLHTLVYVRNICAHHCRLWNRTLSIRPVYPRRLRNHFISVYDTSKVYYTLSMIVYLLNIINPTHSFKTKVTDLIRRYPSIDVAAMGFPPDWKSEALWQ